MSKIISFLILAGLPYERKRVCPITAKSSSTEHKADLPDPPMVLHLDYLTCIFMVC
jgi:hypothetical protein